MASPKGLPGIHRRKSHRPARRFSTWAMYSGFAALLLYLYRSRSRGGAAPATYGGRSNDIFSETVADGVVNKAFALAESNEKEIKGERIEEMFAGISEARHGDMQEPSGGAHEANMDEPGEPEVAALQKEVTPSHRSQGPCDRAGGGEDGIDSAWFSVEPLPGVDYRNRSEREWWWGGIVSQGTMQPYGSVGPSMSWEIDLKLTIYNQNNPVLVSNKGRYLWLEKPRKVWGFEDGRICIPGPWERGEEPGTAASSVVLGQGQPANLRGAFQAASEAHFPPTGLVPDELLFSAPQYNLWIECNYYPTQERVLSYAKGVLDNGFVPGVLMIDTNWAIYYGSPSFDANRFPEPAAMITELHNLGFKVMVWVTPFISPDSTVFRYARRKNYLVKNHWGGVGIPEWWDGHSALLDARNPKAVAWYRETMLEELVGLGVDGFKFDGGDPDYYRQLGGEAEELALEHTKAFGEIGLSYNLSEYRACYKLAGTHLVQRLCDKSHTWDNHGLAALLPNGIAMGLSGYAFSCPDMIGGGQYLDFYDPGTLDPKFDTFDPELFVRYAQASAMFPMMQFSLAPWRMLDDIHLEAVSDAAALHTQMAGRILELAQESARTGEPILRSLEFMYPGQGYAEVRDQFMLGGGIMVAPILKKGQKSRSVHIPPGKWSPQGGARDEDKITGPSEVWVDGVGRLGSPVTELMWFVRIDD